MASMESNYEINVAFDVNHQRDNKRSSFTHYCKIELGNISNAEAIEQFGEITQRFPAKNGWKLDLRYWECIGKTLMTNQG